VPICYKKIEKIKRKYNNIIIINNYIKVKKIKNPYKIYIVKDCNKYETFKKKLSIIKASSNKKITKIKRSLRINKINLNIKK
jgi:hypothetical protein